MRLLFTICFLIGSFYGQSQEELLNQCIVFVLDSEVKTDLRNATFDLPFAAMRASKENEKQIVPHYAFDIQSADAASSTNGPGLSVVSMRSYEYGETLADNEIAFFVMEWPEGYGPEGMGPMLASFPSINGMKVVTDHLVLREALDLSEKLVSQLGLESNKIVAGNYSIRRFEVEY